MPAGANTSRVTPPLQIAYLLRHGETQSNRADRFSGRRHSPLTVKGINEAKKNGRALRRLIKRPDTFRFVCSPLPRAQHTAKLVREALGLPHAGIETDDRLIEIDFGVWDGLTLKEIERDYGPEWQARLRDKWHYQIPQGESYAEVAKRVKSWMDDAHGELIVVTHGAVERVLRGLYADLPPDEILKLDEPQDTFFRLEGGQVHRH